MADGKRVNGHGVSLRDYFESRFDGIDDELRHERELRERVWGAHDGAHSKDERTLEARLDALNELRDLVDKIQNQNVTREYFDSKIEGLVADIKAMNARVDEAARVTERRISAIEGRFSGVQLTATALGAVAIVVASISAMLQLAG